MIHRRHRLAARFLAIGLLAATLFTVDSLTAPSPAEARCNGVNNPVTSTFSYGGGVAVSETPRAGTCNGNDIYTGVLKDTRADGLCVSVWFHYPGQGWFKPLGAGPVCGTGSTSTFEWNDTNDNSSVYQMFRLYRASNLDFVAEGWGTQQNTYGLNHGF